MTDRTLPFDPVALLDALKGYPFLHPYRLAVYSLGRGCIASRGIPPPLCSTPDQGKTCCGRPCPLHQAAHEALELAVPVISRCHLSLFGFAVRLGDGGASPCCLVGWGGRTESLHLIHLEKLLRRRTGANPFAILDHWSGLPVFHREEVKQVAKQVYRLLPSLQGQNLHSHLLEKTEG
ncbi:MAG TPA: hypothetical protein VIU40_05905, partial [Geobacteraceae bacterium]